MSSARLDLARLLDPIAQHLSQELSEARDDLTNAEHEADAAAVSHYQEKVAELAAMISSLEMLYGEVQA